MIDSKMLSIFLNFKFFDTPAEPRLVSFDISSDISYELIWGVIWGYLISNDVIWYQMSSHELKWRLIWAQMTSHMSSNETHMRFGERWRRTAMWGCVSTLITGGVHIDHPHTTNIAGNSKWFWKFKIRFFCLIWDLKWEIEVYRRSKIDEKTDVTKKKFFPKNKKL